MSPLVTASYLARSGADEDAIPPLFTSGGDSGLSPSQYAEILATRGGDDLRHVAVHLRLPFCPSRCLSCDHHTTVTHDSHAIDDYLLGLEQEITMVTDRIGRHLPLAQLHLGGGTPNYLSDTQLVRLMDIVEQHFTITPATETSLEASPKRCSPSQLALLRGLGFQIINFQVRDLNDAVQLAIGRSHSLPMLQDVFQSARSEGFATIGMDLVYGLPNQTVGSVRETIANMLELGPERILCQSFSRRADIFKHQRALDAGSLPSLGDKVAMFNLASDSMLENGYHWVGLDCFAREDDPLAKAREAGTLYRNWVGYTAHQVGDLFGFGADAITQIGEANVQNQVQLAAWREALDRGELPVQSGERVTESARRMEQALTTLLCNLELADYRDLLDVDDGEISPLAELEKGGMVTVSAEKIEVTEHGRFALHQLWGDASPHFRGSAAI